MIEQLTLQGQGWRQGRLLSNGLEVALRVEPRLVAVRRAGSYQDDLVDRSRRHESLVRFFEVDDSQFADELMQLAAGATDKELPRRQRDGRWAPAPIDLVLEERGERRSYVGARLWRPLNVYGELHELDFRLYHEHL